LSINFRQVALNSDAFIFVGPVGSESAVQIFGKVVRAEHESLQSRMRGDPFGMKYSGGSFDHRP